MPRTNTSGHTDILWARVDSIIALILENDRYLGSRRTLELVKTVMERFNVEERTAYRYIAEAKKEIKRFGKLNASEALLRAIRDREFLLTRAKGVKDKAGEGWMSEPDYKLYLEILKDRDKLLGLYEEKIRTSGELTVKNFDLSRLTDHGLERVKRGDSVEEILRDPKSVKSE